MDTVNVEIEKNDCTRKNFIFSKNADEKTRKAFKLYEN
jgi:hypothetical protein